MLDSTPEKTDAPLKPVGVSGRYDIVVVTTAALPWRTGPAIIGLWHACGLTAPGRKVAFGFPWVGPASQTRLYGEVLFPTPQDQQRWMIEEARRLGCPGAPDMFTYRAVFSNRLRGVFPTQDVLAACPSTDVLVLEEPEHLSWYPTTIRRSRIDARKVVGVVMTNYPFYIRHSKIPGAGILAWLTERIHAHRIRTRTDIAVPIAPVLPVANLRHPVREERITGALDAYAHSPPVDPANQSIYFLGRLVWEKGLRALVEAAAAMNQPMDVLGDGPDRAAIEALAVERKAPVRFLGNTDSPWEHLPKYRIFFNPSLSETLCTTILEALVAGRQVVLPDCPANGPFKGYPNVFMYDPAVGPEGALRAALATPVEAPDLARAEYNWPAACARLAAVWEDETP
jgi:digalactosyldiacylglycerol synthase